MKHKLILTVLLAMVVSGAIFATLRDNRNQKPLSDLALRNIEALTSGEAVNPNSRYGYKLTDCIKDGRVVGMYCAFAAPNDVCTPVRHTQPCD